MLRAALLGVLTLTAVSCKSHDAGTSASQTVAAGKVIEVVGTVTLHHGTDTRPLAKGDMIDADDVVETGADGSAVIENQNNNVNWEIGANKKGKLRESLAWGAPKKNNNAKASEQDSTAAGRHAERSAADNSVTAAAPAETEEREDRADEKAPAAPQAAVAPQAPPTAQATAPAPGGSSAPPVAAAAPAPPPPPAPPPKTASKGAAPGGSRAAAIEASKSQGVIGAVGGGGDSFGEGGLGLTGTGQGGGGTGEGTIGLGQIGTLGHGAGTGTGQGYGNGGGHLGGGGSGGAASPNAVATKLVHTKDADFKKCFKAGTTVTLRITIDADGKAKVFVGGVSTEDQKTCVKQVVDKLEFAKQLAMVALTIKA